MAAPVQATLEGTGESQNGEESVDYVAMLEKELEKKKVKYVADAILDVYADDEDITLGKLLDWNREGLCDLVKEINDDEDNEYEIRPLHQNRFADSVVKIANQRKELKEVASKSQVVLLFLGKDEEEAIETIQSGQDFMKQNVNKMKKLFNDLDENTQSVKDELDKISQELKQKIDNKQKEMVIMIDKIYKYHLNKLNARNKIINIADKTIKKV